MSCASCALSVETILSSQQGVNNCIVNFVVCDEVVDEVSDEVVGKVKQVIKY